MKYTKNKSRAVHLYARKFPRNWWEGVLNTLNIFHIIQERLDHVCRVF